MPRLPLLLLVAAGATLAACGGRSGPAMHQTQSAAPTVTYSYSRDGDYEEVAERADDYCEEEYGRNAVLLSRDSQGDRYEVTFSCE